MNAILFACAAANLCSPSAPDAPGRIWKRDAEAVQPERGYILEGRLKAPDGEAWLRVDTTDKAGMHLERHDTPRVRAGSNWTYVAVELPPTTLAAGRAAAAIELWGAAGAEASDVQLSLLSPRVMANGDFEAPLDAKGRVPLWSEEKTDVLLPGRRAGSHRLETAVPRSGKASIALSCAPAADASSAGDWYAVGSVSYPIPLWSDRFEIAAMARSGRGMEARVFAVWTDDGGERVLRADQGPVAAAGEWRRLSTGAVEPPAGARLVRAILAARRVSAPGAREGNDGGREGPGDGTAWFDEAELVTLPAGARAVKVAVNQVGYDIAGPKSAVVMTNFFPADSTVGAFEVVEASGQALVQLPVLCAGRMRGGDGADWGWYFWRADFSALEKEGACRARARIGGVEGTSFPFAVGRDLLFRETAASAVDFFFVQRCGFAVPGWHEACHLDDARLPGGTHRELTGGWHSAGDYNKITWEYGDGGAMYALQGAAHVAPEHFARFDRDRDGLPDVIDEAAWGARYLARLQVAETGGLLKHIQQGPDRKGWMRWVPPEAQTDNKPGTADDPIVLEGEGHSPLAPGGWARLGKLLESRGVKNDYVACAMRLWDHATKSDQGAGDPLLLLSALDLHRATGEERFLVFARRSAERLAGGPDGAGAPLRGGYGDSGDIPAAALAAFALAFPGEALVGPIRERLARHLERMAAEPANPFGVTRQKAGVGGFFFEPSSVYGQSFLFGCRAWSSLLVHRLLGDRRALVHAVDQLDFLLGKNPYNLCMFEGKGSFNPPRYHHRYDSIPGQPRGAVPGAIPNGFVRDSGSFDRPGFDLSTGGRPHPSYRTSEPWLVHNVFYLLAVTALHDAARR